MGRLRLMAEPAHARAQTQRGNMDNDLTTPDGIAAHLRELSQEFAHKAAATHNSTNLLGYKFVEWEMEAAADAIELALLLLADAQAAAAATADATPPHGIERPALNTCVVCHHPAAPWNAKRGEHVHTRCRPAATRCLGLIWRPNSANPDRPYAYPCDYDAGHTGAHRHHFTNGETLGWDDNAHGADIGPAMYPAPKGI